GLLLGTGGDNGNGSSGTFYEGVMTSGYPTEATTDAVQANIVAARYDVPRLGVSRLTTFTPRSAQDLTETFTNTTGAPISNVKLSLSAPAGWTVAALNGTGDAVNTRVAPGATVTAKFTVTAPSATGAGFVTGEADGTGQA